ncbi:siderophore-interacting protein [Brooklawnia cerclae]|uniref:NADPH-dependent ferric siderophore reductase n=1 Tax=Brooklawnia cerclae TaxID=349934 RepID=A0ABX0SI34_9ACTN|nr:SIP domain-containing protein [Brooklawnia cerclae]NIH56730.1 NADPH-dependent ferric siderophore reductase [Brooklawnia cerclae]
MSATVPEDGGTADDALPVRGRLVTIVSVEPRSSALVRIYGTVSGRDVLDEWASANMTIRLVFPASAPGSHNTDDGRPPDRGTGPVFPSRVFTIADVDPGSRLVAIDVVKHREPSPVMAWLNQVRPGDVLGAADPRQHRLPGVGSPRILLADSSALAAVFSILTRLPVPGATSVIAAAPTDEVDLFADALKERIGDVVPRDLCVVRVPMIGDMPLSDAFAGLAVPCSASVWAAGEHEDVQAVGRRCRDEFGLPPESIQVSGYWRRDRDRGVRPGVRHRPHRGG